ATSVIHRLFAEIAPRYKDRPGGYTRIIRLSQRRIGDHGDLAILQLVGEEEAPASGLRRASPGRRKKRAELRRQFAEGKLESRKRQPRAEQKAAAGERPSGEQAAGESA